MSYTIHLRQQYVVAPMDQETLFSFMMCGVQKLSISPLGAQFIKMVVNGSEKVFCVERTDYRVDVCRITKGAHIEHLEGNKNLECCSIK